MVVWLLFLIFVSGLHNPGLTSLAVLLIHGRPRPMSGSFADSAFFTSGGASLVTCHTDKLISPFLFVHVLMFCWFDSGSSVPLSGRRSLGGSEFTKLPKGIQVALRAQIRLMDLGLRSPPNSCLIFLHAFFCLV
ncbi:hypothetical protein VPH35_139286 [Triticum aestivum]